jgi:hypothetical protein
MRKAFMRKPSLSLLVALVLFATLHSAAQKTNVDWDHNITDFSKYRTYAWVKPLRTTSNPLMDQRIVAAVDAQLAEKGLRKVEAGADVLVTYNAGLRQERSAIASGMGGWRRGGGMGRIDPVTENIGTLVVDISDGKSKNLIWRGLATDTLSDQSEKNTKKIEKAVEKMFKKYPPKTK